MKKRTLWICLLLTLAIVVTGCTQSAPAPAAPAAPAADSTAAPKPAAPAESPARTDYVLGGGPQGGNWYGLAGQVASELDAAMPNYHFSVMPGGGIGNISLTQNGDMDIATTVAHLYNAAVMGKAPYDDGTDYSQLTALANIGDSDSCMVIVRKDVPYDSIQDMIDAKYPVKLVTTLQTSTPYLGAIRILDEYGVSLETLQSWGGSLQFLDYSDGCQLIADGHADGIIAPEVSAIVELATNTPLKILPLSEDKVDSLVAKYGYSKNKVPAGKYSYYDGGEFWSLGEPNILLCRKDLPDDIAYTVCKLICEKPDIIRAWGNTHAKFDPDHAHENIGGDLHPGAVKYFTESGNLG